jgi:predicted kinase
MKGIILVMGLIGTGKSTLAGALGEKLAMKVISSDPLRKKLAKLDPFQKREDDFNQGIYSPEMTKKVYQTMIQMAQSHLLLGEGVILDATFSQRKWRDMARNMAQRMEVPFLMVVTEAPPPIVKERLTAREKEKVASDGRWEVYLKHRERFQEPQEGEGPTVVVDTQYDLDSLVKTVKEVTDVL